MGQCCCPPPQLVVNPDDTHLRENLPLPRGLLLRPPSSWYVARTATELRLLGAAYGQNGSRAVCSCMSMRQAFMF